MAYERNNWTICIDLLQTFGQEPLQEALRAAGLQRVARRNSDNIGCPVYRQKYDPLWWLHVQEDHFSSMRFIRVKKHQWCLSYVDKSEWPEPDFLNVFHRRSTKDLAPLLRCWWSIVPRVAVFEFFPYGWYRNAWHKKTASGNGQKLVTQKMKMFISDGGERTKEFWLVGPWGFPPNPKEISTEILAAADA